MKWIGKTLAAGLAIASFMQAGATVCSEPGTKIPGIKIEETGGTFNVGWQGDHEEELRTRFDLVKRVPTVRELAVRERGGAWKTLGTDLTPEFRVASGYRRLDSEALPALQQSVGKVTQAVLDHYKWDAFWDAPLHVPGDEVAHHGATPALEGIPGTDQPKMPRKADEVVRASATFSAVNCTAHAEGGRLEVEYPGVELGVFQGCLRFTIYAGSSLLRMELIAKTSQKSVAYKYDAGLTGFRAAKGASLIWRDPANTWQSEDFSAAPDTEPAVVRSANRLLAFGSLHGSLATFPPPHNFFWVREISTNQGYTWYRKDAGGTFALGICQAEQEDDPAYAGRGPEDRRQNFALYNARPGTEQRMPVYFELGARDARTTMNQALAYTRDDHYKSLPNYSVMARHFHTSPVSRLLGDRGLSSSLGDFDLARATGVNLFGPVGGGSLTPAGSAAIGVDHNAPTRTAEAIKAARTKGSDSARLAEQAAYYEMARLHARKDFLVMPDEELFTGPIAGHNDVLVSHPVFWTNRRLDGQPFVEDNAKYGKVYHLGSPEDLLEMTHREDMLVFTPHPDTKASAGYPRAFAATGYFHDENYRGIGFRWGMGVDRSEQRLCDYRCFPLLDELNNRLADLPVPPKFMDAIAETYQLGPGDDFYANTPATYIRTATPPTADNFRPVIDAMRKGDFFVTSGEVLIPSYRLTGTGAAMSLQADVEWTFPLEFAEIVWGDGARTDRQLIPLTSLPAFGSKHFSLPFDATEKKWVRFAVWDSAGNGAFVQPVKLNAK